MNQIEGCPVVDSVSGVFLNVFIGKMEVGVSVLGQLISYERYIDNTCVYRNKY